MESFQDVRFSEEAERRYLNYALSVITARALPDVRDGLKPVHRRILYAMHHGLHLGPDAKPKKCATIVGDVMGKYHPHGDTAIYDALVRMAQEWVLRGPLVYGHGNFGSLDGDEPAAMRYTEARLQKLAMELLEELARRTVAFRPNFDGTSSEPVVLPARFPNLLVNGSQGIAVGMATNIPPHNLGEVMDAAIALVDDPGIPVRGLLKKIKGPDFPTGGELLNTQSEIAEVYEAGQGSFRIRSEWTLEEARGAPRIILTSVPYGLEKKALIEKIADVIISKKLPALVDIRDESTDVVRIVLELKKDGNPELVMAYLYKHTPVQTNVQVNLTSLVPISGTDVAGPQRLDLKQILRHFLDFRFETVTKRIEFDLEQLRRRLHILEGLLTVFDALDEIIKIVRKSEGKKDAAEKIMKRFRLDEEQTDAILELKLYKLARLEIQIIQEEAAQKRAEEKQLAALLKGDKKRWELIKSEMTELRAAYADKRRTRIVKSQSGEPEFSAEDFIIDEDAVVIVTAHGWLKRQQSVRDLSSTRVREGDRVLACQAGSTRAAIAFFGSQGSAYVARIADVPQSTGYGEPIQSMFKLADREKVSGVLSFDPRFFEVPPPTEGTAEPEGPFALAVTRRGLAFRFSMRAHRDPSTRAGRKFARLKGEGDEVLAVLPCDAAKFVIAAADDGHAIAVKVDEIPILSGAGQGSMLIKLSSDARLIGVTLVQSPRVGSLVVRTDKGKKFELFAEGLVASRGSRGKQVVKRSTFAEVDYVLPAVPVLEQGS